MNFIQREEKMKFKSYHYIFLSGLFGMFSILADQYSYQLEKSISVLEYAKDEEMNKVEFGTAANKLGANLQSLASEQLFYSIVFEDISIEEKTRNFNQLKLSFSHQINDLSANELFLTIEPESLAINSQKYFGLITTEEDFYDDLLDFYNAFYDDLVFIITKGSEVSSKSLASVLSLFEKIADLRFQRQISLITAICSSFLSLLFIFVFFKRFIGESSRSTKYF